MKDQVRVRFAPSPTGYLHVGGLRTALYNYLFARRNNGIFILRIEDTDRKRYVEGAVDNLLNTLKQVGIKYDEGPVYQSERTSLYLNCGRKLLDNGNAYRCFCTPEDLEQMREEQRANNLDVRYDGRCRNLTADQLKENLEACKPYVIRAKIPQEGSVSFEDVIRGKITFEWKMVEDQVLIKSDGYPTYHLACVVDDHEMGISHIIRGEEWVTSCPKHIFLYNSLGWDLPVYAHLPLLLNPDKSKLSKRQGDVAVEDFLSKGYLPEALVNYVALLGWNPGDDRELFSLDELKKEFSLSRIGKAGAVFDVEKLKWMNGMHIRQMPTLTFAQEVKKYFLDNQIDISDQEKYMKVIEFAKERVNLLPEIIEQTEMFYHDLDMSKIDRSLIEDKTSQQVFRYWIDELRANPNPDSDFITQLLKRTTEKLGVKGKKLYFPLRVALYGKEHGPNIPQLIAILGRDESLNRFEQLLES